MCLLTIEEAWRAYWRVRDEPLTMKAPSFRIDENGGDLGEGVRMVLSVNLFFEEAIRACPRRLARGEHGFALYRAIWERERDFFFGNHP